MALPRRVGLFFGSFNPVHTGHLIIAEYMASLPDLDQVWLVVSPQNPLKIRDTLAKDRDRLHMVRLAIEDNTKLKASNIEFSLPKPSYTIDNARLKAVEEEINNRPVKKFEFRTPNQEYKRKSKCCT